MVGVYKGALREWQGRCFSTLLQLTVALQFYFLAFAGSYPRSFQPDLHSSPANVAKAPKGDKPATKKRDTTKLVHMFMEKGMTVREIADSGVEGLKGISNVYVHFFLFGTENSGGVSKEQQAHRKEQAPLVAARRKVDGKLDK